MTCPMSCSSTDWLPISNRFHAAGQRQFSRKGKKCVGPLFLLEEDRTARPNGPTERAQMNYYFMEIDITVDEVDTFCAQTRCCCAVACAKGYRS